MSSRSTFVHHTTMATLTRLMFDDVYNISSSANDKPYMPPMIKHDILLAAILIPFFCILLPAMMCMIFLCSRRRRRPTRASSKRSYRPDLSTFLPRNEIQQVHENTTELQKVKALRGSRMRNPEIDWDNLPRLPPRSHPPPSYVPGCELGLSCC